LAAYVEEIRRRKCGEEGEKEEEDRGEEENIATK
jgi:hypothetical protein